MLTEEQARQICQKKIIVCEGPAGAGKTALLRRLSELPHCSVVSNSLGKRSFGIKEAGTRSFVGDLTKMTNALLCESPVVFIDRLVASQKVYHSIRTDRNFVPGDTHMLTLRLFRALARDLAWRLDEEPIKIQIFWLFLVPSAKILHERRQQTDKHYHYNGGLEIYSYKSLSNAMLMRGNLILRPSYDTIEDQNHIVESTSRWLEQYPYLEFHGWWHCLKKRKA